VLAALVLLLVASGCAPRRLPLPSGTGQPLPASDAAALGAEVFAPCGDVRTLTAELGLSGRAGSQRLRGRLIAGLAAPASIRLEGVAPFGPPVFILAASPAGSTLLLPRADRVLEGADPASILEALAGVSLDPDALRLVLAGCPPAGPAVTDGRRHGDTWRVLALADGAEAYLRSDGARWQLAALGLRRMVIEYGEIAAGRPGLVRLVSRAEGAAAFDVRVRLSQVEWNTEVPAAAFEVLVPSEAHPLSLEELREAGPMRDAAIETTAR
jgi:hypothetical protein